MYCRYCGKNIDENIKVCPFCGIPTFGPYIPKKSQDDPFAEFNNSLDAEPVAEEPAEVEPKSAVAEQEPQKRVLVSDPVLNAQANYNGQSAQPNAYLPAKKPVNGLAIAGFVIALVGLLLDIIVISCDGATLGGYYIISLIFSIVGTVKSKKLGSGKGLGIAGIVISAICLVFWAIVLFVAILIIIGMSFS